MRVEPRRVESPVPEMLDERIGISLPQEKGEEKIVPSFSHLPIPMQVHREPSQCIAQISGDPPFELQLLVERSSCAGQS